MHPQVFNQLNSRKIKDEYNVFDGLMRSRSFIYISLVEVVLQVRGKQCGCSRSRPHVQQLRGQIPQIDRQSAVALANESACAMSLLLHTSLKACQGMAAVGRCQAAGMCQQLVCTLQLIIMLTPIRTFFKVDYQTWYEWVIAIALGVGALLWAFIIKLVSRWAWHTAHQSLHHKPAALWQPQNSAIQQTCQLA